MILVTGKNSGFTPSEINSSKQNKKFRTGFTLVEIMVSIAILSLGLIVILQGFTNALNILRVAENNLATSLLSEEKMVEIEINVKPGEQVPEKYLNGSLQSGNIEFQWQTIMAVEGDYEDLYKALTKVTWREGRRSGVSSLSTYLVIPHGQR